MNMRDDDITAIMTGLGCRTIRKWRLPGVLRFRDASDVLVTVTQEGDLLQIMRWSSEWETQLTDEAGFRKAAEAVLQQ